MFLSEPVHWGTVCGLDCNGKRTKKKRWFMISLHIGALSFNRGHTFLWSRLRRVRNRNRVYSQQRFSVFVSSHLFFLHLNRDRKCSSVNPSLQKACFETDLKRITSAHFSERPWSLNQLRGCNRLRLPAHKRPSEKLCFSCSEAR